MPIPPRKPATTEETASVELPKVSESIFAHATWYTNAAKPERNARR